MCEAPVSFSVADITRLVENICDLVVAHTRASLGRCIIKIDASAFDLKIHECSLLVQMPLKINFSKSAVCPSCIVMILPNAGPELEKY